MSSFLGSVHTYPDIFENSSFLFVLGELPRVDGVFGQQKRSITKPLSRVDLFENADFMLSCGRVKTELFENADLPASIYDVSEHARGSSGITQGHSDCLSFLSKFEQRSLNAAAFSCGRGYFRNAPRVDTDIFHTDRKKSVVKNVRIRVDEALVFQKSRMFFRSFEKKLESS